MRLVKDFHPKLKDNPDTPYSNARRKFFDTFGKECSLATKASRTLYNAHPDEIRKVLQGYYECELSPDFLCFSDVYSILDVPSDFTVIDIGCYQGIQAYYYENCKQYIGVDIAVPVEYRLHLGNTAHYLISAEDFTKEILPTLNLDLQKTLVICSYVPSKTVWQLIIDTFPYHVVSYCDEDISVALPAEINIKEIKE